MFKKVLIIIILIVSSRYLYSQDYPDFKWGLSFGLFYSSQEIISETLTIESQADSISQFIMNIKFGTLVNLGYYFNTLFALGVESGLLVNSYKLHAPIRIFGKLGTSTLNFKLLTGMTFIRDVASTGDGLSSYITGSFFEYGARLEIIHLYIEVTKSISFTDSLPDSIKISFGYSIFLPFP